jgi:hypothetical protein
MQRTLVILVIVSIAFIAIDASPETDVLGWDKASWGMTHSQLEKLYEFEGWKEDAESQCKLKKPSEIEGYNFQVHFVFDRRSPSGKLIKVWLVSATFNPKNKNIYDKVMSFYIRKYGKPDTDKEDDTKPGEHYRTLTWLKSSGHVTYKFLHAKQIAVSSITHTMVGSQTDKK